MSQVIKPSVGRHVHFRSGAGAAVLAAIVTRVFGDRMVNLAIFDPNGVPYTNPPTSITLVQPGDEIPESGPYCEWMEYQISQAAPSPVSGSILDPAAETETRYTSTTGAGQQPSDVVPPSELAKSESEPEQSGQQPASPETTTEPANEPAPQTTA